MNNSTSSSDESSYVYAYYSIGVSIGFLLLMIFIAVATYYCTSHRNAQNWQSESRTTGSNLSNSRRTVVMDSDHATITIHAGEEEVEAILNSYPMLLFSQAKLHKPDSTTLSCSICLSDYKDSEWLRLLPDCGHSFHKDCIDMWLRLNLSCPVCRNSPFQTPLSQVIPLATRSDCG